MGKISTLNELSQLRDSKFGRPSPRHGLNLLYWFAHDYVTISNNGILPIKSPASKAYGFHRFYNFCDEEEDQLLPNQKLPYYGVGNLHAIGADQLPSYVRQGYTHRPDDSNMDRVMVCLNSRYLDRVYITQHINQTDFGHTYRISQGLLLIIKNMTLQEFLQKVEPLQIQNQSLIFYQSSNAYVEPEPRNDSWCVIL